MFARTQRGKKPIVFPYREVLKAVFAATLIAAAFLALPDIGVAGSIVVAIVLLGVFLVGLVVMRVIPRNHWEPLAHMARSSLRGSTVSGFNPRAGIRSIPEAQRKPLRRAIKKGIPEKRLRGGKGEELVGILRRLGDAAGVPGIVEPTERDEEISLYLFERAPTAVRNASMRRLLADGAPSDELRALEDLTNPPAPRSERRLDGRRRRTLLIASSSRDGTITIRSGSIVTSTLRRSVQCSE